MKRLGFAATAAVGITVALVGLAAPAQASIVAEPVDVVSSPSYPAGVDHQAWLDQIGPHVVVPQVDTSVHQSR
jgi:hypothetical protein